MTALLGLIIAAAACTIWHLLDRLQGWLSGSSCLFVFFKLSTYYVSKA